jgi:hypothetical protein
MPDTGKANIIRTMPLRFGDTRSREEMAIVISRQAEFVANGYLDTDRFVQDLLRAVDREDSSLRSWIDGFLITLAAHLKKDPEKVSHWVEKNHNLEFYIDEAVRLFRNPHMIFIVRDPRDAWASWKKLCALNNLDTGPVQYKRNINAHVKEEAILFRNGFSLYNDENELAEDFKITRETLHEILSTDLEKGPLPPRTHAYGPAGYFAENWVIMLRRAEANTRLLPNVFRIVQYEELVRHCRTNMVEIARFIGLMFHETLLYVDRTPSPSWDRLLPGMHGNSSFIMRDGGNVDEQSVGSHEIRLDRGERGEIEEVAGNYMVKYGYL